MYNCAKIWSIWRMFNFSTKFSLKHVRGRFKINGTREWLSFSKKSLIWLFRWLQSLLGDFQMLSDGFSWFQVVPVCMKFLLWNSLFEILAWNSLEKVTTYYKNYLKNLVFAVNFFPWLTFRDRITSSTA